MCDRMVLLTVENKGGGIYLTGGQSLTPSPVNIESLPVRSVNIEADERRLVQPNVTIK